nr:hypothetical protein [Pseudarthrobacter psychrotolerans]
MNPALQTLFTGFFDDAATFPPGLAPLATAVSDAVSRRGTATAGTVGPSIIKLEDVPEARRLAQAHGVTADAPLPLSIVVPPGSLDAALAAAAAAEPQWRLAAIELKVSDPESRAWQEEIHHAAENAPVPVYVELAPGHLDRGGLDLLAETGLRLKYRTGGLVAAAFPTPEKLADVIVQTVRRNIPFKLTAGLHQAARYTDASTGFTHHGFLTIAQAVDAARRGADETEVALILAATDAAALAAWAQASDGAWRQSFGSFGTCSVSEPLESLAGLGLVPAAWAADHEPHDTQEDGQ